MSIAIVVLLANIYLFNTAHKDLARARSITEATNLATSKIADFRADDHFDDRSTDVTVHAGRRPGYHRHPGRASSVASSADRRRQAPAPCGPAELRFCIRRIRGDCRRTTAAAISGRRRPAKSYLREFSDLNPPPVADLVGDLVKIKVDVAWIGWRTRTTT